MRTIAFLALSALACQSASDPATAPTPGPDTAAEGAADGWQVITGRVRYRGTEGRFEWIVSPTGSFRTRIEGPIESALSFDGIEVWRSDDGSPAYRLELHRREVELLKGCVATGAWQLPDPRLEIAEQARDDEHDVHDDAGVALELRLPDGKQRATLTLDPTTKRVSKLFLPGQREGDSLLFEDWKTIDGVELPGRIIEGSDAGLVNVYEIESVRVLDEAPPDVRERPRSRGATSRFLDDVAGRVQVRQAKTGHLFVRPLVDGQDVGWFLFDTGVSVSLIAPEVADELGLEPFGDARLFGFGPDVHEAHLRRVPSVQLGPLEIQNLAFIERVGADMASRILGEPVAGVLGWDVMLRAVVVVDAVAPSIEIHDPASGEPAIEDWRPLTLHWRVPYVRARFEGHQGLFCLDTGAGQMSVLFHSDAVQRLDLLAGRSTKELAGRGGAGGEAVMRQGDLAWFEVAGHRVTPAPALFSTGEDGEADPYALGFLGGEFLKPFAIVFDYANRRVAFEPRTPGLELPEPVVLGAKQADMVLALEPRCTSLRQRSTPLVLPTATETQNQVDVSGFFFAGRPREVELLFADDALDVVWILTEPSEHDAIELALEEQFGEPSHRRKGVTFFSEPRIGLRTDPHELVYVSDRLLGQYLKFLEGLPEAD